jgi:methyl-accepting chemotaxis protein
MKQSSNEGVLLKEELISSASQTSAAAIQIASTSKTIENQFVGLSERVSGASEANQQMKTSLQSLDEYVQDQMAMVEESTSSVTEMISSINNVADITTKKRAATETLVVTAESGGNKLNATTAVISEITENLDEIKGMATIIEQIASQTNLLAMNAAIEAAHAGDAGRGFAVVADEIRKLAEAASMNSKQISGVLKEVVNRIEIASASSKETEEAFRAIDGEVQGVSQSLDEISSSMDELAVGGQQILEAMVSLQDVSVKVGQGSDSMMNASSNVSEAIDIVARITAEVSGSASEINIGITEVSNATMLVTDLSEKLGEITDNLELEAAAYKTEEDDLSAEEAAAEIPGERLESGEDHEEASTSVTLAGEKASIVELEELS